MMMMMIIIINSSSSKYAFNESKVTVKHLWCKLFPFQINTFSNNASWAANQPIRMISEGSCDTEDWGNDAENSAVQHRKNLTLKCIKIADPDERLASWNNRGS